MTKIVFGLRRCGRIAYGPFSENVVLETRFCGTSPYFRLPGGAAGSIFDARDLPGVAFCRIYDAGATRIAPRLVWGYVPYRMSAPATL